MSLRPQQYLDDPEVRDAVHGWLSDVVQRANGTSAHRQASFAHFLRQLQSPEFFGQVEPLELPGRGWMLLPRGRCAWSERPSCSPTTPRRS